MRYIILLFSLFLAFSANAKSLQVLASYPPIQSLVLGVTNGIEPVGVIYRNSSAGHHDVPLKPSQMKALKRADVLFWAGPELENNIPEALAKLNTKLISVPLMEQTQGLSFEPLATDAQKNDPHFWLDPDNALKALNQILKVMIELDPNNRAAYEKNATHYKEVLQRLQDLNTVDKTKKFVALHSGFDYFFKSFGLNGTTMNIDPEQIKTPAEKRQFFEKLKSRNRDGRYLSIQYSLCLAAECHRRLQLHVRLLLSAHLILEPVHTKEPKIMANRIKPAKTISSLS